MKQTFQILFILLISWNSLAQGTLLDHQGEIMRGTPMVLGKNIQKSIDFATDLDSWNKIKKYGLNTVRVCWIDPWYKTRNRDHFSVEEVLPYFDRCVENATATGINIIINYHNVGAHNKGFDENDMQLLESFWQAISPRYKDNHLVYYEIENEPVFGGGAKYLNEPYRSRLLGIYRQIRRDAPERQILLFSFNTASASIVEAIEDFDDEIDWDKTSVAYHMYGTETASFVSDIMKNKRVICTEWDYIHKVNEPWNFEYIKVVDGFRINAGAMELIGSGWIDWRDWSDTTFNELDTLKFDAIKKGYWWGEVY